MIERLDHGILNIPLAKRGNINAQLDRYKAQQAQEIAAQARQRNASVREKKARVVELLAGIPDARVLALAASLGKKLPSTARAALASVASSNLDIWVRSLEREASR